MFFSAFRISKTPNFKYLVLILFAFLVHFLQSLYTDDEVSLILRGMPENEQSFTLYRLYS